MPETTTITLGGKPYVVRKFTMGQMRRLLGADFPKAQFGFEALKLALARADPAVPESQFDDIEADAEEYRVGVREVLVFSGLAPKESQTPGEAQAGVTASATSTGG